MTREEVEKLPPSPILDNLVARAVGMLPTETPYLWVHRECVEGKFYAQQVYYTGPAGLTPKTPYQEFRPSTQLRHAILALGISSPGCELRVEMPMAWYWLPSDEEAALAACHLILSAHTP